MAEAIVTDQFSLRWNNFSNNLMSGFMSHLSDKDLVDVTLAVDGQLLQAHKLVLSICSPYFKDIFKSNPCQHPVIILQDIGYAHVAALLSFMYQGEVNVKQEELATFLKVAEILQIKGLTGDGTDKKNSIPQEDLLFSSETLQSHSNSDSKEHQNLKKRLIDPEDNLLKKNRETRKNRAIRHSTKKIRLSVPALRDMNLITVSEDNIETVQEAVLGSKDDNNEAKSYSCDENSEGSVKNHDTSSVLEKNTADLTTDQVTNEENENELIIENTADAKCLTEDISSAAVEPVTYRLSARGRPQLVHEGYVYNLTSRSEVLNRSHYRCAEQHRGCRGKCAVIAERFMPTGVYEHNHLPGYQSENEYRKKKSHDSDQN
ncbi:uncharacterized protein [Venturia canescens]|uniref:uncharacterized protein n=1 Tax=Venturia canescens TaxID=32260 RepID=UPI001C9C8F42|nr:uncharacterized protein LOC122417067 [Venturia canescens]XP_043286259.1 uncharacterized protein LOC122417067 [Venturia canescens]XP_043286268.1 uncharacterized protein LOC122417067 [Venturia canescens]